MSKKLSVSDYMDQTEVQLIQKFFSIDPLAILLPHLKLIEKLPNESTYQLRNIGESDFHNIIRFYQYESKIHEREFWMNLSEIFNLPNKKLPLVVSKIKLEYFWLDYVTDINIEYIDDENNLKIVTNPLSKDDIYQSSLELICVMLFVSDFNLDGVRLCTESAWCKVIEDSKLLNGMIRTYLDQKC